ncbi:MAG: VWA domain-containing protein [Clostridiales bacterium]|nr:VWA domain-containing protein [Clostridiales bacterium]
MEKNQTEKNLAEKNMTELVFILDRSGSMGGLESDTIGGYNTMLAKQQEEDGECRITTVLFDNQYDVLHDRLELKAVGPITEKEYFVRGSTALLDAVGRTVEKIKNVQKASKPEYRADKVLFVITTDGMENSSREYSYERVKKMVKEQTEEHGWEFVFLGANIDAFDAAESIGISRSRAQNYCADGEGVALNYAVVGEAIAELRAAPACARLADDWGDRIEEDYKKREGGPGRAGKAKKKQ